MAGSGSGTRERLDDIAATASPTALPSGSKQNTSMSLLANLDSLLSPETVRTANELRRQMWTGGLTGLGGGLFAAVVSFGFMKMVPSLQRYTNKNYVFAAVLFSGSLGSFLGAVVNGKNAMQMEVVSYTQVVTPHDESFLRRRQSIIAANKSESTSDSKKKSF